MEKLINFLMNRGMNIAKAPVDAPAFSITKVLVAAATSVLPIVVLLITIFGEFDFDSTHIVALILGILAFLAIVGAADVLARARASCTPNSDALAGRMLLRFDKPLRANKIACGPDTPVNVYAVTQTDGVQYLAGEPGKSPAWVPANDLGWPIMM